MRKKNEVSVAHHCGLKDWGTVIKKELGFAEAKTGVPVGIDPDMFLGSMIIDEFRSGGLKIHVRSSAQKVTLFHQDGVVCKKDKFFLLNSCSSLLVRNSEHRKIISAGDSIILPAWEKYTEECFSGRISLSFIFDISSITDSVDMLYPVMWKNISTFKMGFEINKIIGNFYNNFNDRFCEKNSSALLSLLGLETEITSASYLNEPQKARNERCSTIISFIRNNIKNPEINLSSVAEYLGITERMVQYTLAEEKMTFHQLLSSERCKFLANKIKSNLYCDVNISIYESGFKSTATANRQFKNILGVTPHQYQRQTLKTIDLAQQ
ncbi:TPA: helix-turn-helix transcriptional regulator [Salmonella enterica subsp. enterica serovar Muenchen]|nr:helix-turn-helix transcriptional regulator [Salmonella enterica subsp. enterica]EDM1742675.1 AraC family transcriptional regulator [Salmonella enterica subsp. enterica serovar Muenchen]EHX6757877.1 helix-turn-helix transcriptional regulator [Salmonella enterica subsp. enterica serovar Chester]HAK0844953.1 helix-turn-helix transcriptional regulator [Salmonella enterica]EHZ1826464.1 helix-turn-helix transcriptional regulator [Salmonella enterica subsp. enterica serovar Chester]